MALQNHIHLGLTLTGSPELAPLYKWSVVYPDYMEMPRVIVGLKTSLDGHLQAHRLVSGGSTIKYLDYRMTIKVAATDTETLAQRLSFIRAMNGEMVKFCPLDHAADGAAHTSDIKNVFLQIISSGKPYTPSIVRYDYEILLTDNFSVP